MKEIGGYFGLDLPFYDNHFPNMLKYQSARAALRALLEHLKVTALLLPFYICDSVVQAVVDSGVHPIFYSLDHNLSPNDLPETSSDCYLLYVNYFGLNEANISNIMIHWPKNRLIIDNSQALFAQPAEAIATIYSLRKFLGVPDGGMLYAPLTSLVEPDEEDMMSITRFKHLLFRSAYSAQTGYSDYLAAERTFDMTNPLAMSKITRRLVSSVDLEVIKRKRRTNFKILSNKLNKLNALKLHLGNNVVPLCYPLLLTEHNVEQIKKCMIQNKIFVPTYWSEVNLRTKEGSFENYMVNNCLALPCDQRYGKDEMDIIVETIYKCLNGVINI